MGLEIIEPHFLKVEEWGFLLRGAETDKEPQELLQARTLLKQIGKAPDEKKGMLYLMDAFSLLDEVIQGPFQEIYKERAIRIRTTYISVVVSKVREVMTEKKILDKDFFYWWQTINSLIDIYSENILCPLKGQLFDKWLDGLSLQEFEEFFGE